MHSSHRSPARFIANVFFLACLAALVWYGYTYFVRLPALVATTGRASATVEFNIARGEGLSSIATRLKEAGVISDEWALTTYLDREGLAAGVQAGHFSFPPNETIAEVATRLQRGGANEIRVTILEGWDSSEIDAHLVSLGLITPNAFSSFVRNPPADFDVPTFAKMRPTASLEGYIFPATYAVSPSSFTVASFVKKMLVAMEKNVNEAGYAPTDSRRPLHDILTMASIIELEERDPANQPLVADILYRRLDDGWQLGADATLFYALGHREHLSSADLAADSPYNTRARRGLPPTPVASPGLSAIRAALHPQANEFWYYLHDTSTGAIHYATTLDEHNKNKAAFIR